MGTDQVTRRDLTMIGVLLAVLVITVALGVPLIDLIALSLGTMEGRP